MAERAPTSSASAPREDRRLSRGWKILHRDPGRARGAAGRQHDRRRQPDQGRRGDHRRRRDPRACPAATSRSSRGRAGSPRAGAPIVLIHCYSCSLHWWDELAPMLARDHRVIRIDLLGHGGSQKPKSGYSMEDQAALGRRGARPARRPGRGRRRPLAGLRRSPTRARRAARASSSTGWSTSTRRPSEDDCSLPFLAKLGYAPVIGEALWRLTPGLRGQGRLRRRVRAGLRPRRRLPESRSGRRRLRRDDLHLVRRTRREAGRTTRTRPRSTSACARSRSRCSSIFGAEDQICDAGDLAGAPTRRPRRADRRDRGRRPLAERREARGDGAPDRGVRRRGRRRVDEAPAPQGTQAAGGGKSGGGDNREGTCAGDWGPMGPPTAALPPAAQARMCSTEQKPSAIR